jgi:hypothetical protein
MRYELCEILHLCTFTPLKNSNGTPFDSSTKLQVTTSNDAPVERPILNLRGYKTPIINKIENSLKLFSIIIQNGKSYVENVKISKSR